MLGVGAGAPAPPLVRARAPPPVVAARLPRRFSSSSLRRRTAAAAASKQQEQGRRRRWWSDEDQQEEEEEEEYYEDFFPGSRSSSSFGGELFDEPWFSKVFKTYGFLLPMMLASMLVATGPKAFLMAMAIPLAQSTVSFLLDAIWGRKNGNRRPFQQEEEYDDDFAEYSSDFAEARDARDGSRSYNSGGRRRPQSYQSWVSDDFPAAASASASASADNDDYSTNKSSSGGGFGGWEELLDKDAGDAAQVTGTSAGYTYRRKRTPDNAAQGRPGAPLSRRRRAAKRGRMSSSSSYKQAPLLMRLMIAVFPFLGSWFRLH